MGERENMNELLAICFIFALSRIIVEWLRMWVWKPVRLGYMLCCTTSYVTVSRFQHVLNLNLLICSVRKILLNSVVGIGCLSDSAWYIMSHEKVKISFLVIRT